MKAFSLGQGTDFLNKTTILAEKYQVKFVLGKAQTGCPGIMNPLGETPEIELAWGVGRANLDKAERFVQFGKALEIIDLYVGGREFRNEYIKLNIHGRVMLAYIAEKNDCWEKIYSSVADILTTGLNLLEVPYGKGGSTVSQIYDIYLAPKVAMVNSSMRREREDDKEEEGKDEFEDSSIVPVEDGIELSAGELQAQRAAIERFEVVRGGEVIARQLYLAEKPLFTGKFVHQYLIYIDEQGQELQTHGMAVDHNGMIRDVGVRGNRLQVFIFDNQHNHFEQNSLTNHHTALLCVDQEAGKNWDIAMRVVEAINQQNCKYDPLGATKPNSNSVAATLCYVMGHKPMKISGLSVPGLKKQILLEEQCESIAGRANVLDVSYGALFSADEDYTDAVDATGRLLLGELDNCPLM